MLLQKKKIMNLNRIKTLCNRYVNSKKGFIAEIDNYKEDMERITFDVRILKSGVFRSSQSMSINLKSELTPENQLRSQIERFSALVENNRF
jgi:hypothetical protein